MGQFTGGYHRPYMLGTSNKSLPVAWPLNATVTSAHHPPVLAKGVGGVGVSPMPQCRCAWLHAYSLLSLAELLTLWSWLI